MKLIATCKLGLEALVSMELRALGLEVRRVEDARVRFEGTMREMARACLWLRTAERVLLEVGAFTARSFEELFEGAMSLQWKDYIARDAFIHVNGKSAKSALFSVSDCQSIIKKAIVENLRAAYKTSLIPETGAEMIVEVGLLRDEATLALDCCGAGLSRRGYRTYNVAAPLSETLGAAVATLSRHKPDQPLIDPMCGSGTMPIEAAMIAQNRAPGQNRSFAFEVWPFFPIEIMEEERRAAADGVKEINLNITGSDIDARSIELCKRHAKKAGVMLKWQVRPLSELATRDSGGVILCNPPYGERMMKPGDAEKLYRQMRQTFDGLPEWAVNIITSHQGFERVYGKRADKRRKLTNGGIPCTLYQYFRK